jgi:hypothetical protein
MGRKRLNQISFGNFFDPVAWGRRRTCKLPQGKQSFFKFLQALSLTKLDKAQEKRPESSL